MSKEPVDVLAFYSPRKAQLVRQLRSDPAFASVDETAEGWVVATPASRRNLCADSGPLHVVLGDDSLRQAGETRHRFLQHLLEVPQALVHHAGDFTCLHLGVNGHLHFARSCSGIPPLYVATREGEIFVSTRLRWIGLVQRQALRFDLLPVAIYSHGWASFPDGRTALAGVKRIPPGAAGDASPGMAPRYEPYWRPEALPRLEDTPDNSQHVARELRRLLQSSLEPLADGRQNVLLFSGGLDSSCLAVLARSCGVPLDAVSVLPPADDVAHAREAQFVHGLKDHFAHHHVIAPGAAELLQLATECPGGVYMLGGAWTACAQWAERAPNARLISGWFADECFGQPRLADWIQATTLRQLPQLLRRSRHKQLALARWAGLWQVPVQGIPSDLSPLFPRELQERYQAWRARSHGVDPSPSDVSQLHYRRVNSDYTGVYSEFASSVGASVVLPFAQREVIELAYATPPGACFAPRLMKLPLRHAVPEMPRSHLMRRDKGGWQPLSIPDIDVARLHPQVAEWVDKHAATEHAILPSKDLLKAATVSQMLRWLENLEYERARVATDNRA